MAPCLPTAGYTSGTSSKIWDTLPYNANQPGSGYIFYISVSLTHLSWVEENTFRSSFFIIGRR